MSSKEALSPVEWLERLNNTFDIFRRVLSGLMMLLGLRHWAIILGLLSGAAGAFETMPTAWQIGTAYLAVVDLVAAVGLWQLMPWGNVVWVGAAVSEIVMHTLLIGVFGPDHAMVALHAASLAGFIAIAFLRHRAAVPVR